MSIAFKPTRPVIKVSDLHKMLAEGIPLLCGEFRGSKVDKVEYVDKVTGQPASFFKLEMNIELAIGKSIPVEHRLPKGVDNPAEIEVGLKKGQQVALRLAGVIESKGRVSASVGSDANSVMILA